jgi:hypothetical protein
MKTYLVTAALKHPGIYHSGYETEVMAKNKKEAMKIAKRQAERENHFSREDGAKTWKAREI